MENLIVVGIIVIVAVITAIKGIRIVPQGSKFIVQRLGKYRTTLGPGMHMIVPFVDTVPYKVTTKDIVLEIPSQEVITEDNAAVQANAVAYINIVQPEKAMYGVENFEIAIQNLVQTTLRSIIGEMALDKCLSSRDIIRAKLREALSDDISDWGINLKTVEIQDINPTTTMQNAMEEQASAERRRRAAITTAEGEKQAAILEAEGRKEAAKLDAAAQVALAEGSKQAIEKVIASTNGETNLSVMYLLGERYVQALTDISQSEGSKTVLMPADLPQAVRGLLAKQ